MRDDMCSLDICAALTNGSFLRWFICDFTLASPRFYGWLTCLVLGFSVHLTWFWVLVFTWLRSNHIYISC